MNVYTLDSGKLKSLMNLIFSPIYTLKHFSKIASSSFLISIFNLVREDEVGSNE
jgi:hypothetical protein